MRATLFCLVSAAVLVPGCAGDPVDELAGETDSDGEAGKGDGAAAFTYFAVTPDLRACSFDARCGGFFVERANRTWTACPDGSSARRCYVDEIDWVRAGLDEAAAQRFEARLRGGERILLRGDLAGDAADRALLATSEIWVPHGTAEEEGVFVLVRDNGVRCVTTPCASLNEARLNSNRAADIHEVDLEPAGAGADADQAALDQLAADGLLVAGYRFYSTGSSKGRAASRYRTKVSMPAAALTLTPITNAPALAEALAIASADSGTLLSAATYAVTFASADSRDADAVIAQLRTELAHAALRQDEGPVDPTVLDATLDEYGVIDSDQRQAIDDALQAEVAAPVAATRKLWLTSEHVPGAHAEWAEVVLFYEA